MKEQNEKQTIEEMYKDIYEAINHNSAIDLIHGGLIGINTDGLTRELFDDGYRKHSENTVEFPCKVGDRAWLVFTPRFPANPSDKGKWFMVEDGVQRLISGAKGVSIETWNMGTISAREIGKKLFFTKEEAEKVLAKMKGGAE